MKSEPQVRDWLLQLTQGEPLFIAGPCSAETEDQVLVTAHGVKQTKAKIFRSGIWKPRTRPGGFEGIGAVGLQWLSRVKAETGLLTAVEVANAAHVQLALEHDIDVLWIGARTTVNPFLVQEIADSMKGIDKVVLVKNPVNPDVGLWLGGIERIFKAGINKLGAVHRGFSTYDKSKYRNKPEWQIAIELRNQWPNLPILCDPSHITGNRKNIADIAQQALNLSYDGLMIETHHAPEQAWSDAAQQLTPQALHDILNNLIVRQNTDHSDDFMRDLQVLRTQIDDLDNQILESLGRRMKIADQIGLLKRERNVAVLQAERWRQVLDTMVADGDRLNLSSEFIQQLFQAIHQESITHQQDIIHKKDPRK